MTKLDASHFNTRLDQLGMIALEDGEANPIWVGTNYVKDSVDVTVNPAALDADIPADAWLYLALYQQGKLEYPTQKKGVPCFKIDAEALETLLNEIHTRFPEGGRSAVVVRKHAPVINETQLRALTDPATHDIKQFQEALHVLGVIDKHEGKDNPVWISQYSKEHHCLNVTCVPTGLELEQDAQLFLEINQQGERVASNTRLSSPMFRISPERFQSIVLNYARAHGLMQPLEHEAPRVVVNAPTITRALLSTDSPPMMARHARTVLQKIAAEEQLPPSRGALFTLEFGTTNHLSRPAPAERFTCRVSPQLQEQLQTFVKRTAQGESIDMRLHGEAVMQTLDQYIAQKSEQAQHAIRTQVVQEMRNLNGLVHV